MGENGEASSTDCADLEKRLPEQDVKNEEDVSSCEEGQVKEEKKTSDAILDELFSSIRESGTVVDVAEVITEVSRSRKERATREKSRSRSRSRDRKHKHKKNKKDKKPKKHRSRSRSNDRKRRHRSRSSSPRFAKTGTLADIRINTKTKNLDDLKNTIPVTSTFAQNDDDDDLPVGADYRTVMAEAVASSEPSTSQGPSLADLPTAQKMQPAFPLKKSDGEKKDAVEEKSSPMLKKVISEKGGALLVPRKIQIDASKNNGNTADSFGPALPPAVNDESKEDEEDVEMTTALTVKSPPKIAFGQISLKVNGGTEKKEEGNGVKKEDDDDKMEVDENAQTEGKIEEKNDEKSEDKDKKAAKKMAVRRRRSSSIEESRKKEKEKKEKERKRSRSRSKDRRDRDRSRDKGRDGRRDGGRSDERNRRDDRRRRSRSRSAERRRDGRDDRDRDRDRRGRRSRSRENRRSRSKSREKIDKKKLLEIALQNARGVSGPVAEKQGVNMKILEKAGGRNIGDIVSYCQKLSETENAEKLGGGRGDSDDDDFSYKSKKEIKMNIPGSKQLPTSTPQERLLDTAPLRAAFPVSSGVIHRDNTKESSSEWKKVDRASIPSVCTPLQKKLVATSSLNKIKAESEGKSVPMAAFPILPPPPAPPTIRGDLIPPPPPPPMFNPSSLVPPPPMPPTIITPSHDRLIHMPDSGCDEVRKKK